MKVRQRILAILAAVLIAALTVPSAAAAASGHAPDRGELLDIDLGRPILRVGPGDPIQLPQPPVDSRYPKSQWYSVGIARNSDNKGVSQHMSFQGYALWNDQGEYRVVGTLVADCGGSRWTTVWLEHGTEGSWHQSPETGCSGGIYASTEIDVYGSDRHRESFNLRLATWSDGTWDLGGAYQSSAETRIQFSLVLPSSEAERHLTVAAPPFCAAGACRYGVVLVAPVPVQPSPCVQVSCRCCSRRGRRRGGSRRLR